MHGHNNKPSTVKFTARWEVEYENITSSAPHPRAMLGGWFATHTVGDRESDALKAKPFTHRFFVEFQMDVRLIGEYPVNYTIWVIC